MLISVCSLAACGGSSAKQSADEKQVRAVVTELLTTKAPSACTRLATQRLVEQSTGERGTAALRSCRAASDEVGATSVSVGRVAISGPRASAEVHPKGGTLTFTTAKFGMRKEGASWKVDRLKGGTLDRPALYRLASRRLSGPAADDPKPGCIVSELKGQGDAALEATYVGHDQRALIVVYAVCGIRAALSGVGAPAGVVACAERRTRRELTSGATARLLLAAGGDLEALNAPGVQRRMGRIGTSCAHG